jgi:hypothetical protein
MTRSGAAHSIPPPRSGGEAAGRSAPSRAGPMQSRSRPVRRCASNHPPRGAGAPGEGKDRSGGRLGIEFLRELRGDGAFNSQPLPSLLSGGGLRVLRKHRLHRGNELRPNRNHADEQRNGGQRSGLFDKGSDHRILPRTENEHCSTFVLRVKTSNANFVRPQRSRGAVIKIAPRGSIRSPDGAAEAAQSGNAGPGFRAHAGAPSGLRRGIYAWRNSPRLSPNA